MLRSAKTLILLLVLVTTGIIQFAGLPAGFLCACTGQMALRTECVEDVCHPLQEQDSSDGKTACRTGNRTDGVPRSPDGHSHTHEEVRDSAQFSSWITQLSVPPLVLCELPVSFYDLLRPVSFRQGEDPGAAGTAGPAEYLCPPMAQMVRRTVVLVV